MRLTVELLLNKYHPVLTILEIAEVAEDFVNRYLQRSNVSTPDSVPGLCPQDPCFVPRSFELAPNCEKCLYSTANPPIHKNVHRQIANASLYIASSGSKSANIAIKRSRQDINSIVDSSMERMYECATWRMYHRITSSRRAKTSVVNLDRNDKHSNPTENQFDFGTSLMDEPLQMDANQRLDDYAQPKSPSDFNLDGEVFTLDI